MTVTSLAQYHAQEKNGNIIAKVDEQGKIHEVSNQDSPFVYGYRTENEDLSSSLEKAGVNISTFNKLLFIQDQFNFSP